MKLFIDTSNDILILVLFDKEKVKDSYIGKAARQLTEKTIPELKNLLDKNNLTLKNINDFYVAIGPGSYTGVRVGLTIIKTIYAMNENINVYCINSLLFQVGMKSAVSIIDAKGGYKYFAVYDKGQEIIPPQLLLLENVQEIAKSFTDYIIIEDYHDVDFLSNLINLQTKFEKTLNVADLEPLYIKKAI